MAGEHDRWLRPRLDYLLELSFAALDGPTGGVMPPSWSLTFPGLWKPSEAEIEATRSARTTTDIAMQTAGWVTPEQVAEQRLVNGSTVELKLDAVNAPPPPEPEPEPVTDEGPAVDADLARLLLELGKAVREGVPAQQIARALQRAGLDDDLEALVAELELGLAPPPGVDPETGEPLEVEQDAEPAEPTDADIVAASLEPIPRDLASSTDIATALTERLGYRVTPHKVTRWGDTGRMPYWQPDGGRKRYSMAAAMRILAENMGTVDPTEPEPEPEPPPVVDAPDAAEPDIEPEQPEALLEEPAP